jgi:hypothetical protein
MPTSRSANLPGCPTASLPANVLDGPLITLLCNGRNLSGAAYLVSCQPWAVLGLGVLFVALFARLVFRTARLPGRVPLVPSFPMPPGVPREG